MYETASKQRVLPVETQNLIALSEQDTVLDDIRNSLVMMAIWARELSPALQSWLESLPDEDLPTGRVLMRPDQTEEVLYGMYRKTDKAFVADVGYLISRFAEITGNTQIDLRLDCISHDACWKFHQDQIDYRLLCTYRGPGTEFVSQDYAGEALRRQRDYRGPLQHLDAPFVGLFKGSGPANGRPGVVHRSPPASRTGGTRYLLCLSPPFAGSPPPFHMP